MDREHTLRILFPQIDARLIKATVLEDGDDMDSAVDFLIQEGMQPTRTEPNQIPHLTSKSMGPCCHFDKTLMSAKNHDGTNELDDEDLTDFSCDKHEESIVWKGVIKTHVLENPPRHYLSPENEGHTLDNYYDLKSLKWQSERAPETNQLIDWWAATWPSSDGMKEGRDELNSVCSTQTDLNTQEEAGTLLWSDTRRVQTCPDTREVGDLLWRHTEQSEPNKQSNCFQEPTINMYNSFTESTQSSMLEEATSSMRDSYMCTNKISGAGKTLVQGDLPQSQESFDVFQLRALERCFLEETPFAKFGVSNCQPTKSHLNIDKVSSEQSVIKKSVWADCVAHETVVESSRYNIDMEDLDNLVFKAKCSKGATRNDIEDIYLLRRKLEEEEVAAQHAKAEAASAGLEIFQMVEEMRQQTSLEKAAYEMRAAEVYGEKSVLSMEARELKTRLQEAQVEQAKVLSLVDAIRSTLLVRLVNASHEKHAAMEEATTKVKNAKELLATEQASAQKLGENLKVLEAEAEMCKKLRNFLVERGNLVDSLQGEMAVLCEDVLAFKRQVDESIPLCGSHLTDRFLRNNSSPLSSTNYCKSSRLLISESFSCLNSLSSASIVSLSSATSKHLKGVQCGLHSQYFSPGSSVVETSYQGSNTPLINEKRVGEQEKKQTGEWQAGDDRKARDVCNEVP